MQVTGLDHVTVIITDLARSREFYSGLLGLTEVAAPYTFDFVVLWFRLNDRQYLHLLHKPDADSRSPRHFALAVDDIESARARCRSAGLTVAETVEIPGADRFFIHDPDGNRIEIIAW